MYKKQVLVILSLVLVGCHAAQLLRHTCHNCRARPGHGCPSCPSYRRTCPSYRCSSNRRSGYCCPGKNH